MLSIKHEQLTATINPLGAELSSLRSQGQEYLWQGDETVWSGRAPILFPIVGTLANNRMSYRGKTYHMPRHGIAHTATFNCIDQTESKITMQLRSDTQLLQRYPWKFNLNVHFSLKSDTLSITYEVMNLDSDTMIFTLGSHPAFNLPLTDSTSKELSISDFDILFNRPENLQRILLGGDGLLATNSCAFELENNTIKLSDTLFNQDALVFKNIESNQIVLRSNQEPRLSVNTGGAPHLGIWAKPGARYVCIEPWYGISDYSDSDGDFEKKSDMLSLQPKETFSHTICVTIAPHHP
ncbi:MAG: aldose 1-epimerase family protein [Gammaproteobacteria bacterium]|nr:aldose 1-epimerase family protein [Gammaproteobacteria bacterium]